jgi:hypothetical protein
MSDAPMPAFGNTVATPASPLCQFVLFFGAANYNFWVIYMRASLGRAGLIGYIEWHGHAAQINTTWPSRTTSVTTQNFGKIEINGVNQNTKCWSQQKLLF